MRQFKKRMISAITLCAVLVASSAALHTSADNGTKTVEYYKYDLQLEGNEQRFTSYSLTINESNFNTRDIGVTSPDTRKPDTNSSVVRVRMHKNNPYGENSYPSATGFIVDAHTIATAAHVVYNASSAGVAYGVEHGSVFVYDEELNRQVEHKITEVHIPKKYTTNSIHENDYALVTVDADLSEYGVFELGCISNDAYQHDNIPLYLSGFPTKIGDVNNTSYQLYTGDGTLVDTFPECIFYSNDASGGNSGGPLYVTTKYKVGDDDWVEYNTVIGICTGRDDNPDTGLEENDAKRITEPLLQFYLNNPNIGY